MNYDTLPQAASIVYALDIIGVAACTIAAGVLAKRLNFDFFGALMIALIGSTGGGTLRDLLLDRHPVFWLHDLTYIYLISGLTLIVQIFYHDLEKIDRPLRWFDALGLAAFTVIGAEAALSRHMSAPVVILMAAMTGVGGGVMRDIVCREVPLVLHKEIYITASVCGSVYYLTLLHTDINPWLRSISCIALIVAIRMLAVYRNWNFPNLTLPERKP